MKLSKAQPAKIRVSSTSIPLLIELDRHVQTCNIRGPIERFRDIASDRFDGTYFRSELDDLIERRLLKVERHGFDDSRGRDPLRDSDRRLCGAGWSVDPSASLVRALWQDRITDAGHAALKGTTHAE